MTQEPPEEHDPSNPPKVPALAGRRKRASKTALGSYEVGYGRPPKATRFPPGKSGNPKGRSPQSRNAKTILKQILEEPISIREGGRIRRVPKMEGILRIIVAGAFKADPKAVASLITVMKQVGYGAEQLEAVTEILQGIDHQAVLAEYLARAAPDESWAANSSSIDADGTASSSSEEAATPSKKREG